MKHWLSFLTFPDQRETFQPNLDSGIHSQIGGRNSMFRVAYRGLCPQSQT